MVDSRSLFYPVPRFNPSPTVSNFIDLAGIISVKISTAEFGLNAAGDHRIEHGAARVVADAVQQFAARAHFLDRRQVAALVVDAGQSVADELLRDVGNAILAAPVQLRRRKGGPIADFVENAARRVRDTSVEFAPLVAVVSAAG